MLPVSVGFVRSASRRRGRAEAAGGVGSVARDEAARAMDRGHAPELLERAALGLVDVLAELPRPVAGRTQPRLERGRVRVAPRRDVRAGLVDDRRVGAFERIGGSHGVTQRRARRRARSAPRSARSRAPARASRRARRRAPAAGPYASSQREAQRHQRSPGWRPAKPHSGCGVDRSFPAARLNSRNSAVVDHADGVAADVLRPGRAAAVAEEPGQRLDRAGQQLAADDVDIGIAGHPKEGIGSSASNPGTCPTDRTWRARQPPPRRRKPRRHAVFRAENRRKRGRKAQPGGPVGLLR